MLKDILKIILVFVVGFSGGIFADQVVFSQPAVIKGGPITETKEVFIEENTAIKNSIAKIESAVVGVRNKKDNNISGSGIIVTSDGLMITLAELVPYKGNFIFYVDGKTPNWQILKRDVKNNLALVKLDLDGLKTVAFEDFSEIELGERVFLIGKSLKGDIVNQGIIRFFDSELIKTNIKEEKNLAGSPLFNIKGELLGLNLIDSHVQTIPISKIRDFLGY